MWLLAAAVRQQIEQAYQNGAYPAVEQQVEYEARYGAYESDSSRVLKVDGDTAHISVSGVITKSPSFLAMLFGGGNVTYSEIVNAFAAADKNPDVRRAELRVDSPGGHFDGLFDALGAMQAFSKPIDAVVTNQAASAAYALVSQADKITATTRATRFGSIGVVGTFGVDEGTVDLTSTKAPKKRPNVKTEEGRAVVREELDAMHEIFVEAIAAGRSSTPDKVNAEYGQGATLLADDALKRGMIDAIAEAPLRVVKSTRTQTTATSGGNKPETGFMDLATLKAQHPDVYAAARQEGIADERDRVVGHLNLAQGSGLMDDAVKAVSEGEGLTHAVTTKHMMAAVNRRDLQNYQSDDGTTSAAADSTNTSPVTADESDKVVAAALAELGLGE